MSEPGSAKRTRDPARTREAVLDAAETLFADHGFSGTSLQAIGERAGVSRGTPGYFFGSKDELYAAVLERVLAAELPFVTDAQARLGANGGPEAMLAAAIEAFVDFLAARPTFVRLLDREALEGARRLQDLPAHATALGAGIAMTTSLLATGPFRDVDPAQVLLDILALAWFPLTHAKTISNGLGLDPEAPGFVDTRKAHIVALMLDGIRARADMSGNERGAPRRH